MNVLVRKPKTVLVLVRQLQMYWFESAPPPICFLFYEGPLKFTCFNEREATEV